MNLSFFHSLQVFMNIVVNQATQTGDVKEQPVEIVGVVERVLFANAQTGFTVCYIKPEGQVEKVTACGLLSTVHQGNIVQATGCWVQHRNLADSFQSIRIRSLCPLLLLVLKNIWPPV